MKKIPVTRILSHVLIPFLEYLFIGLLVIKATEIDISYTYFVVWAVMAVITVCLRECFQNKIVTVGIAVYLVTVIGWLCFFTEKNGLLQAGLAVMGIAGISLLRILFKKKTVAALLQIAPIVVLVVMSFNNWTFSKILIAMAIVLLMNGVSESLVIISKKNINSFVVIYLLAGAVSMTMPTSEEPYDWAFVVRAVEAISKAFDNVVFEVRYQMGANVTGGVYRYGYTGYLDAPISLYSSLEETDINQLVISGKRTKRNMYLKGNICDAYLGSTWETNVTDTTQDNEIDLLMTLYRLFEDTQDIPTLRRYMEVISHSITFENIRTQSVFYPVKTISFEDVEYVCNGDNIRSVNMNARGYTYTYTFVDIDYASSQVKNMLLCGTEPVYEEEKYNRIYELMEENYGVVLEYIPFEEFVSQVLAGKNEIYENYLDTGEYVSADAIELAHKIVEGKSGNYEKCKALENYLLRYTYSKRITVPEKSNVLDWFLFDGKQGYCSHYATALVSMLRAEKIPARLVEGFLVDYSDSKDFYTSNISSACAHSWVEAYIDGFGWIRLEPTSVNSSNANTAWYADEVTEEETMEDVILEDEEVIMEEEQSLFRLVGRLVAGLVALVVVILIVLFAYKIIGIRRSSNPDIIIEHILGMINKKYLKKYEGETVREFFGRVEKCDNVPEEIKKNLQKMTEIVEAYWYGGIIIGVSELEHLQKMRQILLKSTAPKKRRMRK